MPKSFHQERFKALLSKVGSGQHTAHGMSREESAEALEMILSEVATPAQIGAFMMAHRIRRPEPQELAGMVDVYVNMGPKLHSGIGQRRPICFGMPFDGRNRTTPIYPLTALILLSAGQPVVLQGGKEMPVKYGVTATKLFQTLGLNLQGIRMSQVQDCFTKHGLALIYQPDHFPAAEKLIIYREEIGKRPPLASMELIWTAHQGHHLLVSGFVHPPTEDRAWKTLGLLDEEEFITVKGLEGSTDLPINRACITAQVTKMRSKRLILHPHKYGCNGKDIAWTNLEQWREQAFQALDNQGPLKKALIWNAGSYLWFAGIANSLEAGIAEVDSNLNAGKAKNQLNQLIKWRATQG